MDMNEKLHVPAPSGIIWIGKGVRMFGENCSGNGTIRIAIGILIFTGLCSTAQAAILGDAWTWGYNLYGQLGDGTNTTRLTPVQVGGLTGVTSIAGGGFHTIALKPDGTVWAWGRNDYGQLGDGTTADRLTPVQVGGLTGIIAITGGGFHTIALKSDGIVWAWGNNQAGQLGDGTTTDRLAPVQVGGLTGITAIAGGYWYSLALKSDGTVWAWGLNQYGQLGDGTTIDRSTPVQVRGLTGVTAIAGGGGFGIALKSDGTVWTWGNNQVGQLGDGTTTGRSTPVQVSGLTGVTAIAGGWTHAISLKSDGTVWTWGMNAEGQLGDGTNTNRSTPVQVSGVTGIISIAGGGEHTIALKPDGTVWTWGNNYFGELGDGTNSNRLTPVQVGGLTGVIAIATEGRHSIALKTSTEINTCTVISSPGEYKLTADIINSTYSTCINITSDNVIFDGNGRTIEGMGGTETLGIEAYNPFVFLTNVTVKNLNVTNWADGIYYKNVPNGWLINNTANSNSIGISVINSNNNMLINNIANSNYNNGIYLYNSSSCTLSGNNASNNKASGIYQENYINNNIIINNDFNNNYDGIDLFNTGGNTLSGNTVNSNSNIGIYLYNSSNNIIYNNIFKNSNNTFNDVGSTSTWNITKTAGINIVKGTYLGGNFWGYPNGTGFSQTCADAHGDGICDASFIIDPDNIDYLPLTTTVPQLYPLVITIFSPQNITYNTTSIPLNVSANETNSTWLYSLNGSPNVSFTPNTTITAAEGSNSIVVYANDTANTWNSSQVNFYVDTVPPTIIGATPADNNTSANTQMTVTFSELMNKSSAQSAFSTSPMTLGNFTWNGSSMIYTPSSSLNYSTPYIVTVGTGARDLAGNGLQSPYSWQFTTSSIPGIILPVITIYSPQNITYTTNTIPLDISANGNISTWLYSLNGSPNVSFTPNTTITAGEGSNSIVVYANDTANNWNSSTVHFSVSAPIIITITSPENNSIHKSNYINVTVTLDKTGMATLNWEGVDEPMNGSGTSFYKNKTELLSGNFSFKVYAKDLLGSTNVSETRNVIVDLNRSEPLPINLTTGNLSETKVITAPSGNVTVTILKDTNATKADGSTLSYISIDSLAKVNLMYLANLSKGDKLIGENLSLGPDGAHFIPDIQLRFNYTDEQLAAAGTTASQLKIKFYDTTTNTWVEQVPYTLNTTGKYITANVSHFSIRSLIFSPYEPPPTPLPDVGGPGGGGGGGDGGISGEDPKNIEVKEKYDLDLFKDKVTAYIFTNNRNPIMFVNITGNVNTDEINTAIEVLRNTSSLVKVPAPGRVYKNFNLWVGTSGFAGPRNIKETMIRFRVKNSWITSSGLEGRDVKLLRWDNTTWQQLESVEKNKDDTHTFYEAKTDGFASFAITGLRDGPVPSATPSTATSSGTPTETVITPTVKKPEVSLNWIIYMFIGLSIFIPSYLFAIKKIKKR